MGYTKVWNQSQPFTTIHKHQRPPINIHNYPQPPKTTHNHPHPSETIHNLSQLLTTSHNTQNQLQPPTSSHNHPQPAIITQKITQKSHNLLQTVILLHLDVNTETEIDFDNGMNYAHELSFYFLRILSIFRKKRYCLRFATAALDTSVKPLKENGILLSQFAGNVAEVSF